MRRHQIWVILAAISVVLVACKKDKDLDPPQPESLWFRCDLDSIPFNLTFQANPDNMASGIMNCSTEKFEFFTMLDVDSGGSSYLINLQLGVFRYDQVTNEDQMRNAFRIRNLDGKTGLCLDGEGFHLSIERGIPTSPGGPRFWSLLASQPSANFRLTRMEFHDDEVHPISSELDDWVVVEGAFDTIVLPQVDAFYPDQIMTAGSFRLLFDPPYQE